MTEDFGGGPKQLKMAWVINFHKVITLFLIAGMMVYFSNFSTAAWVYLGLHGIYGYCWLVKDFGFRDGNFESRVTYTGALMSYLLLGGLVLAVSILLSHARPGSVERSDVHRYRHAHLGHYLDDRSGLSEIFSTEVSSRPDDRWHVPLHAQSEFLRRGPDLRVIRLAC